MTKLAVDIRNLTFTYDLAPAPSLQDVSLSVTPGEFVSIIGANGAGKSTLCAAIRGLVPHFSKGELSGSVVVAGKAIPETPLGDMARDVGYVFQNPFTQMSGVARTVFDELAYGLGNLGVPAEQMRERVETMLRDTELEPLRDRNPFELSGGQQQRVALASILVMGQPILVIDEPTSQLDPETTQDMFRLIKRARDEGRTVILVEHKMELVAQFSDRVVLLHDGRVVMQGTPAEVFSDPRCEKAGTRLPESMYLRRALAAHGVDLPPHPLTVAQLITDVDAYRADRSGASFTPEAGASPVEPPASEALLALDDISFSYPNGVKAVQGVSFRVGRGESVGIIGQNGAGKTTAAKLINGLLKPSDGTILVDGQDTAKWTAAQTARRVGYVFQNPDDQIFNKSVETEVGYALKRLGVPRDELDRRVTEALELTGLADQRETNPYDLPPSVRKFVTIASVIANDPEVYILDEPTAGQDLVGLNRLMRLLRELSSRGKAIITITHDMEFVSQNFRRTIVMTGGKVVLDAPTDQVFYDTKVVEQAHVDQPAFVELASHVGGAPIGLSMTRLAAAITGGDSAR